MAVIVRQLPARDTAGSQIDGGIPMLADQEAARQAAVESAASQPSAGGDAPSEPESPAAAAQAGVDAPAPKAAKAKTAKRSKK
jgi:hypothetical protein